MRRDIALDKNLRSRFILTHNAATFLKIIEIMQIPMHETLDGRT